jgi:hypothetical protein
MNMLALSAAADGVWRASARGRHPFPFALGEVLIDSSFFQSWQFFWHSYHYRARRVAA